MQALGSPVLPLLAGDHGSDVPYSRLGEHDRGGHSGYRAGGLYVAARARDWRVYQRPNEQQPREERQEDRRCKACPRGKFFL